MRYTSLAAAALVGVSSFAFAAAPDNNVRNAPENGNTVGGLGSTVSGGRENAANGNYLVIGGGYKNAAVGTESTVGGGSFNYAAGDGSVVSGGSANQALGLGSGISSGFSNIVNGSLSSIDGGALNFVTGSYSSVVSGYANGVDGDGSVVLGGVTNYVSGILSTVLGGYGNQVTGDVSVATGANAIVSGSGSIFLKDLSSTTTELSANNAFMANFDGGIFLNSSTGVYINGTLIGTGGGGGGGTTSTIVGENMVDVTPDSSGTLDLSAYTNTARAFRISAASGAITSSTAVANIVGSFPAGAILTLVSDVNTSSIVGYFDDNDITFPTGNINLPALVESAATGVQTVLQLITLPGGHYAQISYTEENS